MVYTVSMLSYKDQYVTNLKWLKSETNLTKKNKNSWVVAKPGPMHDLKWINKILEMEIPVAMLPMMETLVFR